jgi:hypothetical protein
MGKVKDFYSGFGSIFSNFYGTNFRVSARRNCLKLFDLFIAERNLLTRLLIEHSSP